MYFNPRKIFVRTLPIIEHVRWYGSVSGSSLWLQDLIAGVTVGLTLIPQSIAYAALAGLGPEYGLYSSIVGGIIYMIFGTIPQLNIAPTALLSLLTFSYTNDSNFGNKTAATLLCFVSGITELLCGILHLGFLVDFVSTPVVAGFTSAAAITIAFSQLKNLFGLKFQAETTIDVLQNIYMQIGNTKFWDATLGITCCLFLLGFRELKKVGASPQNPSNSNTFRKIIWFLSVSSNALVVVISALMAFILSNNNIEPFSLTSEVVSGFPAIVAPPLFYNNGTHSTLDILSELGSGVLVVPLIAILSNVAIAKAFSDGEEVNASQEMIAVGVCNMVGAFIGSMPVNASFSRGAVSNASGVRTPISGLYTSILVILALGFLAPYFSLIPKATLAAVIIVAVIFMVEIDTCRNVWKINKLDVIPLCISFLLCTIFGIEIGIFAGIAVNLIIVLYFVSRPKVSLESRQDSSNVVIIKVETSMLVYPSAEYTKDNIMTELSKNSADVKIVVLDCAGICFIDYTSAQALVGLLNDVSKKNMTMVVSNLKSNLKDTLLRTSDMFVIINSKEELDNVLKTDNSSSTESKRNEDVNLGVFSVSYVNDNYVNDHDGDDNIQRSSHNL